MQNSSHWSDATKKEIGTLAEMDYFELKDTTFQPGDDFSEDHTEYHL
jgi:hypothetical protein